MKILFVLNHFLPAQVAGTEVYVLALCKELKKINIQVKVVIPNYGIDKTEKYFFEEIEIIKYAETSVVDRELIIGKRVPAGLPFFVDVLTTENPDIVHFHELAGSNGITVHHVLQSKSSGFKTVFTFHLAGYSCKTGHLMYKDEVYCDGIIDIKKCSYCFLTVRNNNKLLTNILYGAGMFNYLIGFNGTKLNSGLGTAISVPFLIQKVKNDLHAIESSCDTLITLTDWYYKILVNNEVNPKKICIIRQGLVNQYSTTETTDRKTSLPLKVAFIGRISHFKGVHLLLDAINDIEHEKISLDIFGRDENDNYSKNCKRKSANLLNVKWKGLINPEEVVSKLRNYDLLVLPSTFSEMSPLVIQEAFAAGIPVLASDVYGNAEQVSDNMNGWLFKFKDSSDLRKKLIMLINQPSLIQQAKSKIAPPRSFADVASEYIDIYNTLLSTAKSFEKYN